MTRIIYRYDKEKKRVVRVKEAASPDTSNIHALVRPDVSFVSSALCRWDKDHVAGGGKCTKEGKPIFHSRYEAQEYSRRSADSHDVYNTWGDIDGL